MAVIGIDVSKHKLDVTWLRDPQTRKAKSRVFANTPAGFEALLTWLQKNTQEAVADLEVLMEATGVYHEALAYALHAAGARVVVANPAKVKHYNASFGKRSKTDKKDSLILACFLASQEHRRDHYPWQPEPEEVRHLKALLGRREALDKDLQREYNRNEKAQIQGASKNILDSIAHVTATLEQERAHLHEEIEAHIERHSQLKQDRQLLRSIPGIGAVLSLSLLAMLHGRDFMSAGQCAAFAGLIPIMHQSGKSVEKRPRLSKAGCGRLRAQLYMGAVVAIRYNPAITRQYERLLRRGKSKMCALGAAMRKLVQIAYGVLKHQTDYSPQWSK